MKKLSLLLLTAFIFSCEDEIMSPDEDVQAVMIEEEVPTSAEDLFLVVEEQPTFKGGMGEWMKYLKNNLEYPEQARSMGIEGAVYLSFVVDKTGELRDIQVVRGIGAGCDEEAVRNLMNSPDWEPGKQRGREVSTRMQVRIVFRLNKETKENSDAVIEEIETPIVKESNSN